MKIGVSWEVALGWAATEFQRRNGSDIELEGSHNALTGLWEWGLKRSAEDLDYFEAQEMRGLVHAAQKYWESGSTDAPGPAFFVSVPGAKAGREAWKAVPWWKRMSPTEPQLPPGGPINLLEEISAARAINDQLSSLPDNNPVYLKPIVTEEDLAQLIAKSYPVTPEQAQRYRAAGITVSGGGAMYGGMGLQLLDMLAEYLRRSQIPRTPEEDLTLAITQRNSLVARGAAKSLIAKWNAEIRFLSEFTRHHPTS